LEFVLASVVPDGKGAMGAAQTRKRWPRETTRLFIRGRRNSQWDSTNRTVSGWNDPISSAAILALCSRRKQFRNTRAGGAMRGFEGLPMHRSHFLDAPAGSLAHTLHRGHAFCAYKGGRVSPTRSPASNQVFANGHAVGRLAEGAVFLGCGWPATKCHSRLPCVCCSEFVRRSVFQMQGIASGGFFRRLASSLPVVDGGRGAIGWVALPGGSCAGSVAHAPLLYEAPFLVCHGGVSSSLEAPEGVYL